MALSIKSPEADRLARELAKQTGESITDAVITAMRERLVREERKRANKVLRLSADIMEIARHCASLPVYDNRTSDEILGYDENGLPS